MGGAREGEGEGVRCHHVGACSGRRNRKEGEQRIKIRIVLVFSCNLLFTYGIYEIKFVI
jgi:hypothetical protein